MAMKPLRPCRHPGCCVLVRDGYCPAHQPRGDRRSEESKSWRWMYATDEWRLDLRATSCCASPLAESEPRAVSESRRPMLTQIVDHKGDWERFRDRDNLESLCHSCHSRKTARELYENRAGKTRSLPPMGR